MATCHLKSNECMAIARNTNESAVQPRESGIPWFIPLFFVRV